MNDAYKSLFAARVAGAVETARAAAAVAHAGVKGRIREILIKDLFRPLLPADLGVATGHIVTSQNHQSPEQDVIIYDRRILPPVIFEKSLGLLPVESVLATVEVKTKLTATELKSAYENAKVIDAYPYLHGERDKETRQQVSHDVERVLSAVFALDSDLVVGGTTELQRYQELHPRGDSPVKIICVSGRGYWFFDDPEWNFVAASLSHQETVSFIAGLLGAFARVGLTRRRPELTAYLVDASDIVRGVG